MRLAPIAVVLLLIAAGVGYYFFLGPGAEPRLSVESVSSGAKLVREDGVVAVEVPHGTRFSVTFRIEHGKKGDRVVCYCETLNGGPHPGKGRECGSDCILREGELCVSDGWYADAPPGTEMGLACYVLRDGRRIEGSRLDLLMRSTAP